MNWKIPNQLTIARIILAGIFFALLAMYEPQTETGRMLLNVAFWIYIVAGITDFLDGWIARKYNWTSAFGRIADPFVDKVLVLGAFVMLAGKNFSGDLGYFSEIERNLPMWVTGQMASIVQTWMVVVIMSREFIVSTIRSYSETRGIKFPSKSAGKVKMFVQSFAICTVLYQLANLPQTPWAIYLKIISIWSALAITVFSGLAYVGKARKVLLSDDRDS